MIDRIFQYPELNFVVTNRIPRRTVTRVIGWMSRIESPLFVRFALRVWKTFSPDLDLSESVFTDFASLRECFIRELRPGSRPIASNPEVVVSPCDAIVGACGRIEDDLLIQAKGLTYRLEELLCSRTLADQHRGGWFVTLRLRSTMYHRFHAPTDCRIRSVTHVPGDAWNVNPTAVGRVERLYCRNERAVLSLELDIPSRRLTLVPVAAIGVANLRLHCLDETLGLAYAGPERIACDARYSKGDELGWFELGSTIVVLASADLELANGIFEGRELRVGEPLLELQGVRDRERRFEGMGCAFDPSPALGAN